MERFEKLLERFPKHPVSVADQLERIVPGIDYLIGNWKELIWTIETNGHLTRDGLNHTVMLLGLPLDPNVPCPLRTHWHGFNLQAGGPGPKEKGESSYVPGTDTSPGNLAKLKSDAKTWMLKQSRTELARLVALRPEVLAHHEHDREAARNLALIDTSKAGQLLHRYGRDTSLDLARCARLRIRLQAERDEMDVQGEECANDEILCESSVLSDSTKRTQAPAPESPSPSTSEPAPALPCDRPPN